MVYVHYDNKKRYMIMDMALHTETDEKMVIYMCLDDSNGKLYTQPSERFFGFVANKDNEVVPRFVALKDMKKGE